MSNFKTGFILEFLPLLKNQYSTSDLPYHLIIPSLPGYAFSSGPPTDRNFTLTDAADLLHEMMIQLGFGSGYVAQGGDMGSRVARILGAKYDSCKAVHCGCPIFDFDKSQDIVLFP